MARVPSASPDYEAPPAKRKRPASDDAPEAKKRKRKRRTWQEEPRELDEAHGLNLSLARLGPPMMADLLVRQTRKFERDLSSIEAEELHIPASAIHDTSDWAEPRLTEKLPTFLRHVHAHRKDALALNAAPKAKGSPHTLVVAAAALRAADLARVLRTFQAKDARVAKLFSKHIKLDDAIKSTRTTRIGIGVGTPTRLSELLEAGALKVDRLERVVVDASRIDAKTRGILDVRETQAPLMRLLGRRELKEGCLDGKIDLVFY